VLLTNVLKVNMKIQCNQCHQVITQSLRNELSESELCNRDGEARVPIGAFYLVAGSDFEYDEQLGDIEVNLADLVGVERTQDKAKLNGCCGLDGLDGYNLVCSAGHWVGTEKSDCWMPHYAILAGTLVTRVKEN